MADPFKSPAPGSKIWNPINSYESNVFDKKTYSASSDNSPLAMLAEQVRRKRSESSRISPTPETPGVKIKSEPQKFPSHPSNATTLGGDECALDLSTKTSKPQESPKDSPEPSAPTTPTNSEDTGFIGPVFSLAKLYSDSDTSQSDQSVSSSPTKSFTAITPKKPKVAPKSELKKKSPMSPPVSNLRNSPLYKKRKLIPKSPLATARRLKLNPDLSQSTPPPSSKPSRSPSPDQPTPTTPKSNSSVNNKHTGRTVRRMPTGEPIKWLKRLIALPQYNNKKKSYKLLKKCNPCCVVLSKLPLENDQKSLDLASTSERFSDCNKICWKEYGKVHSPWIKALHRRMKRLFAVLLWGQTPKFTSIRMEPLMKTPKPPKSQPRRGPTLQSATPGKRRFFLLELKRKTILIPVIGNQMGERAFELDNPKNIGILYNIAASLQKSSGDD